MYKENLALNNLQWLICHKTQPDQIIYIYLVYMYKEDLANNLYIYIYIYIYITKSYIYIFRIYV